MKANTITKKKYLDQQMYKLSRETQGKKLVYCLPNTSQNQGKNGLEEKMERKLS